MTESYIPLLDMLSRLINDGVDFRLTLSISPSLAEMLKDELLMERYSRHVERLLELSEKEALRTRRDIHLGPVVRMYRKRFLRIKNFFEEVYGRDIISEIRKLRDTGKIEVITSAATHAYLPNLSLCPQAVKAQIKIGAEQFKKNFGLPAQGIWLPECGFVPGFDDYMKAEGIGYFFLEKE